MATNPRLEQLKARPKPVPAAPPAAVAELPPAPKLAKVPKPKSAPKPTVTRQCGHKQGLAELEHTPCLGCLGKARRERNVQRHAARAAKQSGGAPADFRFPAGTEGTAAWTGGLWLLVVTVPGLPLPLAVEATGIEGAWRAAKAAYLGAAPKESV